MHANRLELAISFLSQQNTQLSGNTFAEQYYIMCILKTEANHFLLCNKHNAHTYISETQETLLHVTLNLNSKIGIRQAVTALNVHIASPKC